MSNSPSQVLNNTSQVIHIVSTMLRVFCVVYWLTGSPIPFLGVLFLTGTLVPLAGSAFMFFAFNKLRSLSKNWFLLSLSFRAGCFFALAYILAYVEATIPIILLIIVSTFVYIIVRFFFGVCILNSELIAKEDFVQ